MLSALGAVISASGPENIEKRSLDHRHVFLPQGKRN
jgi:hypothetical protein